MVTTGFPRSPWTARPLTDPFRPANAEGAGWAPPRGGETFSVGGNTALDRAPWSYTGSARAAHGTITVGCPEVSCSGRATSRTGLWIMHPSARRLLTPDSWSTSSFGTPGNREDS